MRRFQKIELREKTFILCFNELLIISNFVMNINIRLNQYYRKAYPITVRHTRNTSGKVLGCQKLRPTLGKPESFIVINMYNCNFFIIHLSR